MSKKLDKWIIAGTFSLLFAGAALSIREGIKVTDPEYFEQYAKRYASPQLPPLESGQESEMADGNLAAVATPAP